MDIFSFINSKDISAYLKEIHYECSTLEAAWIVYNSMNKTLEEKFLAWEEIIKTMPDCKVPKRRHTTAHESLFEYLEWYIATTKELIAEFKQDGVFKATAISPSHIKGYFDVPRQYKNFNAMLKACKRENNESNNIKYFKIEKINLYDSVPDNEFFYCPNEMKIRAKDYTVLSVDYGTNNSSKYRRLVEVFDGLWFDIPTPFKKGDIVFNTEYDSPQVILLTELGININKLPKRRYQAIKQRGDSTDMLYKFYYAENDGSVWHEEGWNYMNLEYYRDKLKGKDKVLLPISMLLKGEDTSLCLELYQSLLSQLQTENCVAYSNTKQLMECLGLKK